MFCSGAYPGNKAQLIMQTAAPWPRKLTRVLLCQPYFMPTVHVPLWDDVVFDLCVHCVRSYAAVLRGMRSQPWKTVGPPSVRHYKVSSRYPIGERQLRLCRCLHLSLQVGGDLLLVHAVLCCGAKQRRPLMGPWQPRVACPTLCPSCRYIPGYTCSLHGTLDVT
jgi:hypothetical protein